MECCIFDCSCVCLGNSEPSVVDMLDIHIIHRMSVSFWHVRYPQHLPPTHPEGASPESNADPVPVGKVPSVLEGTALNENRDTGCISEFVPVDGLG